ncbi:RESA-like protein with DnaJ domain, putative [Plasmodium reichenowi]|uniref:RESA-like protein with DnaJ domain, putative n=1 Tax=Plasmodium reichenowi TaxID=5854 RepID=A0A060RM94_PLARE|nr:RESA-like protein with DnaJ domain, putative [Plasmodium reichenowi]
MIRNNYSFNNNNNYNKTHSSSEEYILDDKKIHDNKKRKNMKKSYEILYEKKDSDLNEIEKKFYNLSLKYYPKMN